MNRTAIFAQKMTLSVARHAQPQQCFRSMYVTPLEIGRPNFEKLRHAREIGFSKVTKPFCVQQFVQPAGLAFEPERSHSVSFN